MVSRHYWEHQLIFSLKAQSSQVSEDLLHSILQKTNYQETIKLISGLKKTLRFEFRIIFEILYRYTSYAVAKIRAYNPINDIEYSTIREQGFLVYLPINNEIALNIGEKSMT